MNYGMTANQYNWKWNSFKQNGTKKWDRWQTLLPWRKKKEKM